MKGCLGVNVTASNNFNTLTLILMEENRERFRNFGLNLCRNCATSGTLYIQRAEKCNFRLTWRGGMTPSPASGSD